MQQQYKVVLIEDETKIAHMIKSYLSQEGMTVYTAGDGATGLQLIGKHQIDVVLLDLMLPDIDGMQVCRKIQASYDIPIIMVTARSQEADRVTGLEAGADDYIVKPFSLAELVARIRAVCRRRTGTKQASVITCQDLKIDTHNHTVTKGKERVELTPTEFKLLTLMASHPGRVFSRLQLLDVCLGEAYSGYERSIDTHISNLRKKIESDPSRPDLITTVFGFGYKFNGR